MNLSATLILYGALFLGVLFATVGLGTIVRAAASASARRVGRRLGATSVLDDEGGLPVAALRAAVVGGGWRSTWPFSWLAKMLDQAGMTASVERLLIIAGLLSSMAFVLMLTLLPIVSPLLGIWIALAVGIVPVVLYVLRARKQRIRKFEEQLSDSIDLLVRSLRVGQSLTSAVSTVARECQEPIASEFRIAHEKVTYGKSLPVAFEELADRVPVNDLRYLSVAIQINHEAGGNLGEALAGMSNIIRDRMRIFRKVKALTAEGRFSAWFLSLFPLALYFMVQLIKPDYYSAVANWPYFTHAVVLVIVLLGLNVIAMRIITSIKV